MLDFSDIKLPSNPAAESSVIASILLDNTCLPVVVEMLAPADFFGSLNRQVFMACCELYELGKSVDPVTLAPTLTAKKVLPHYEVLAEITRYLDGAGNSTLVVQYCELVKEAARRRQLLTTCLWGAGQAVERQQSPEDLSAQIESRLYAAQQDQPFQDELAVSVLSRVVDQAHVRAQETDGRGVEILGIPSGFPGLDYYLDGWQPQQLIYLGAAPGVGKTTLALQFATHAAACGYPTGIFSLEMSRDSIVTRILSTESQIPLRDIEHGRLSAHDRAHLDTTLGRLRDLSLWIDDRGGISPAQIRATAKRWHKQGLRLLVVDYLQLLGSNVAAHSRESDSLRVQVAKNSAALKNLAKELNVAVICLSQLSRAAAGVEPMPHHLRESGNIEADADAIMLLWDPDGTKQAIKCKVAKNRQGAVGITDFAFRGEVTQFVQIDPRF